MKKSAEQKIKKQKAAKQELEQVDPIKNAIVKSDTEISGKDMKAFVMQLDKQDPKFHSDLTTLSETYNHNWKQEQKLHGMIENAKRFNEEEVRVARSEVADKLRPIIEKITSILGDNISKHKLLFAIIYMLRYTGEDGGAYTIHNANQIMKIYEEKYGVLFKRDEKKDKKVKEHDDTKTTYSLKVDNLELMDKVFNAFATAREAGTFKHLLLEIDNHYNLLEMTIVTV